MVPSRRHHHLWLAVFLLVPLATATNVHKPVRHHASSFTIAFPSRSINLHRGEHPPPAPASSHCTECGCSCQETTDPSTADVVVHTVPYAVGHQYDDDELATMARYNPAALRILMSLETAQFMPVVRNATVLQLFDVVASYESTSPLPVMYGPVPTEVPTFGINAPYVPPHTWTSADAYTETDIVNRPHGIAVFISHCVPWRLRLVQELQQYVPIDTFGACFPESPKSDPFVASATQNTKLAALTQYKMVLSLENAICPDWATEKLYGPLLHGAVPVYLGAPNVHDAVPDKHAIIDLRDYADARAAGTYLKSLLDNPAALYSAHHAWRQKPYTGAFAARLARSYRHRNFFCSLCSLYRGGQWRHPGTEDAASARHAQPIHACADEAYYAAWPRW